MKRMLLRPISIYLKIPLEVLLYSKMIDPNRQYSSQVFRFEESIHVLFSQSNFSLNFHFPVEKKVHLSNISICSRFLSCLHLLCLIFAAKLD